MQIIAGNCLTISISVHSTELTEQLFCYGSIFLSDAAFSLTAGNNILLYNHHKESESEKISNSSVSYDTRCHFIDKPDWLSATLDQLDLNVV